MAYLVLIHAVGLAGGLFAKRLRIPAGALLGSMALVTVFNIAAGSGFHYPPDLRLIVQVAAGAAIGLSFTHADIPALRRLAKPAAILVSMLGGFNILFALLISRLTGFDLITALFATAPGGVSDMALIAADFGANIQKVAILQLFRFVFIVSMFPFIVRKMLQKSRGPNTGDLEQKEAEIKTESREQKTERPKLRVLIAKSARTLLAAGAGAALARWLGLPAGGIIGALAATVMLGTIFQAAYLPKWTRTAIQIFAGCFIGSQISPATLIYLQLLFLPMALILAQLMLMTFGTAWVLRRFCKMDRATSLFSSIPGGFMEMNIIAQEMGLPVPEIVLMNTCRLIGVICMMPILLFLFTL